MIIIFYKDLKQDFEKELNCLQENTEKYKIISLPTTKRSSSIGKNGETKETISHKSQFIDSARFMASSLCKLIIKCYW